MKPELSVSRNHGHPWDGRPGFDLMEARLSDEREWESFRKKACAKFWQVWIDGETHLNGTRFFCGVFYKPSGAMSDWSDKPDNRHPGNPGIS